MGITAVVGASWGDEGKGKVTDALAARAQLVIRFQGGRNAGHTIINDAGRFALHLLPSGVFWPDTINLIGAGVALDLPAFFAELDELMTQGVPAPDVRVSDRAQLVLSAHVEQDRLEEERLAADAFGSTRCGIAPFYADKAMKLGVQAGDLLDADWLRQRLERQLAPRNALRQALYGAPPLTAESLLDELLPHRARLEPMLVDAIGLIDEVRHRGGGILLEGQLGALRDVDHGIYPFTTSSSPLAGHGSVGAGVPSWAIEDVVAVVKAYSSCVGAGPFITEWMGAEGDVLRERGGDRGEYGATTGRPRRVGPFDAVAARHGCRAQGATRLALTNLDVLGAWDEIPLCVAYELDDRRIERFPLTHHLARCRPVYETVRGWGTPIGEARAYDDLPPAAREYVERVETLVGVRVGLISVGPHRDQLIVAR